MPSMTLKEDPRLKRATKEFITMILVGFVLYTIVYWIPILAWGSNPYAAIDGMPWWFITLFISIAFMAILMVITYLMKEDPLDPYLETTG